MPNIERTSDIGRTERRSACPLGRLLLRALWDLASTVVPAVLIALCVNVFVAQATEIEGPSMQPNLYYDQWVVLDKATFRFFRAPRRGDVVTFTIPGQEQALIKRVVGLPGETVEVRDGEVFINGQLLEEHWLTCQGGPNYPPQVVPPSHLFVLGDNRPNSQDSRYFGPVPTDRISGRALLVCWPLDQVKPVR